MRKILELCLIVGVSLGLYAQEKLEPVLISPATVDAVPAPVSARPDFGLMRLAGLQDVINFQVKYAARFDAVMRWILSNLDSADYEQVITIGDFPIDPSQSYVSMETVFSCAGASDKDSNTTVLMLRSPEVTLTGLKSHGCSPSIHQTAWEEPKSPVVEGSAPQPFDTSKPDQRKPGCYLTNNASVSLNPGAKWTDTDGKEWVMERGLSWFSAYNRWCSE
jgi:hypothetical protein